MIRNLDPTIGKGSIERYAKAVHQGRDSELKREVEKCAIEFLQTYNDSWLLRLLCGYSFSKPSFEDATLMANLKSMINKGDLYMALLPVDNWASRDCNWEINKKTIEGAGISLEKSKGFSDGLFTIEEPLSFGKIYINDDETPSEIEEIEASNFYGVTEIGDTALCKSVMQLYQNSRFLLRLPYPIPQMNPVCAIFFNMNPIEINISIPCNP